MKAIILAGGFGYRLGIESTRTPKPLIEIGNKPLLWYIMKNYSYNGVKILSFVQVINIFHLLSFLKILKKLKKKQKY